MDRINYRKIKVIPVDEIKNQLSGDGVIEDMLEDIVDVINEDVQKAIDDKQNYSLTEIQDSYDIPNMTAEKSRLHVHYHLLRCVKAAGHEAIIITNNSTRPKYFLQVSLVTKKDEDDEEFMMRYIKDHTTVLTKPQKTKQDDTVSRRKRPMPKRVD